MIRESNTIICMETTIRYDKMVDAGNAGWRARGLRVSGDSEADILQ